MNNLQQVTQKKTPDSLLPPHSSLSHNDKNQLLTLLHSPSWHLPQTADPHNQNPHYFEYTPPQPQIP